MALRSKLLDEEVVKSAKKVLKKVKNNAYVSKKKTKCCNCSKKVQYNGCSKNILYFKKRTNFMGKTLEICIEEKLFAPPQRRRKTKLNQGLNYSKLKHG